MFNHTQLQTSRHVDAIGYNFSLPSPPDCMENTGGNWGKQG